MVMFLRRIPPARSSRFDPFLVWALLMMELSPRMVRGTGPEADKIKKTIFQSYRSDTPPKGYKDWKGDVPVSASATIDVKVGVALRAVQDVNQLAGTMELNLWFRNSWTDPRLAWNDSAENAPGMMTLPTLPGFEGVWTPDLYLYNTAEVPFSRLESTMVSVSPSGSMTWSRPGMLTATCNYDMTEFPHDTQVCGLTIGSWAYDAGTLNLIPYTAVEGDTERKDWSASLDLSSYAENSEFELSYNRGHVLNQKYACCKHPYQTLEIFFNLKRRPSFYLMNMQYPALLITICGFLAACIPGTSGERIGYSITVILALVVYLVMVTEMLPKTERASRLGIRMLQFCFTSGVCLIFAIFSTAHEHRYPAWFYKRVLKWKEYEEDAGERTVSGIPLLTADKDSQEEDPAVGEHSFLLGGFAQNTRDESSKASRRSNSKKLSVVEAAHPTNMLDGAQPQPHALTRAKSSESCFKTAADTADQAHTAERQMNKADTDVEVSIRPQSRGSLMDMPFPDPDTEDPSDASPAKSDTKKGSNEATKKEIISSATTATTVDTEATVVKKKKKLPTNKGRSKD